VSRLVHQKGIDLLIENAASIVEEGGQLVVTGNGDGATEAAVRDLARRYPGDVSARIGFDDNEARAIFEGSDFLIMPSRFEPCGLSQMYAQTQGSLPIAYCTGGLADTIEDGQSGFLYRSPNSVSLNKAVTRAFTTYQTKSHLRRMRRNALKKAFGWEPSAQRYVDLYASALANVG
jgi:starch synthase